MKLTTPELSLELPLGWRTADFGGMDGFAYAPLRHPRFRTTATVVARPVREELAQACLRAVEELLSGFDDVQVLGVDRWQPAGLPAAGRQITSVAALPDGQHVIVTQWLWVTAEREVCLATTVGMPDSLLDAPALHNMAVSARLTSPPVAAADAPLEDLRWVHEQQRYELTGRSVSEAALRALPDGDGALAELGLVREGGATEFGEAVAASRASEHVRVRLSATHGRSFSEICFTPLDRGHIVEAGPPVWRLECGEPGPWLPGTVELTGISFDGGPARAARWLGLGPVWTRDVGELTLGRAELAARVRGGEGQRPWTQVVVDVGPDADRTFRLEWVHADEHGWLAVEGADGAVGAEGAGNADGPLRLTAMRPVTVFHRLQRAFGVPVPAEHPVEA